jgi:hypothetical protein
MGVSPRGPIEPLLEAGDNGDDLVTPRRLAEEHRLRMAS